MAKHLGLQLLRLADAVVLPLNTTQYAFELDGYLSKYVFKSTYSRLAIQLTVIVIESRRSPPSRGSTPISPLYVPA